MIPNELADSASVPAKPASQHSRAAKWCGSGHLFLLALSLLEVHPGGLPLLGGHIHVMEALLGLVALLQLLLLLLGLLIVRLLDLQPLLSTQCLSTMRQQNMSMLENDLMQDRFMGQMG